MTIRVMKARRPGRLACGHWVNRGHLITRDGTGWRCIECAIAAIKSERPAEAGRHSQQEG